MLQNQVCLPNTQQTKHWDDKICSRGRAFSARKTIETGERASGLCPPRQGGWDIYGISRWSWHGERWLEAGETWGHWCSAQVYLGCMLLNTQNYRYLAWSEGKVFQSLMEKEMATHSSTLAWKIPWMEKPGRLQSMGSQRVRHDWATSLSLFTFMHWRRKWQPIPVFWPGESPWTEGPGRLHGVSKNRTAWLITALAAVKSVGVWFHKKTCRYTVTRDLPWRIGEKNFSGKNSQFKFCKLVKGGAVVSLEPTGSPLPLVQNNLYAKVV